MLTQAYPVLSTQLEHQTTSGSDSIRLAAMLATSLIDADAPEDAACTKFMSGPLPKTRE